MDVGLSSAGLVYSVEHLDECRADCPVAQTVQGAGVEFLFGELELLPGTYRVKAWEERDGDDVVRGLTVSELAA